MLPDAALLLAAAGAAVVHRRGTAAHAHRGSTGRSVSLSAPPGTVAGGWTFLAGLVVVLVALSPAVETAAEASFAWHMVQHQLLVLVAAPLVAAAAPLRALWLGATGRPLPLAGLGGGLGRWVLPAGALAVVTLGLWHIPALYDAALASPPIHMLEHATLFGSALLLWSCVLQAGADEQRLGTAVVALAATAITGAGLGVVLLTAPTSLYEAYASGGAVAVESQRIGGALMKVGALLVHAGAAVGLTLRWLHRLEAASETVPSR